MPPQRTTRIADLIREGQRSLSFEFMPPKDEAGAEQLWKAISELEPYAPTFVSVTYGAGGATRDTTVRVTGRIAAETSLTPVAHLTCVGHTREELERILDTYSEVGVQHLMALRGDPAEGPRAPWSSTPGGLDYALDLVEWALSAGRKPIKRPLPSQRSVLVIKHLRNAAQRLTMARLSDSDRQHFGGLLQAALQQCEERLRARFRPEPLRESPPGEPSPRVPMPWCPSRTPTTEAIASSSPGASAPDST